MTPSNTPTGTPAGTPAGTPPVTPSNTPSNTPTGTPAGTPAGTPPVTPSNTPTGTPATTPSNTPTGTGAAAPPPSVNLDFNVELLNQGYATITTGTITIPSGTGATNVPTNIATSQDVEMVKITPAFGLTHGDMAALIAQTSIVLNPAGENRTYNMLFDDGTAFWFTNGSGFGQQFPAGSTITEITINRV